MLEHIISIPVLIFLLIYAWITVVISRSFTKKQIKKIAVASSSVEITKLFWKNAKVPMKDDGLLLMIEKKIRRTKIVKTVVLIVLLLSIINVVLISGIKTYSFLKGILHDGDHSGELIYKLTDPMQIMWFLITLAAYAVTLHRMEYLSALFNKLNVLLKNPHG